MENHTTELVSTYCSVVGKFTILSWAAATPLTDSTVHRRREGVAAGAVVSFVVGEPAGAASIMTVDRKQRARAESGDQRPAPHSQYLRCSKYLSKQRHLLEAES